MMNREVWIEWCYRAGRWLGLLGHTCKWKFVHKWDLRISDFVCIHCGEEKMEATPYAYMTLDERRVFNEARNKELK